MRPDLKIQVVPIDSLVPDPKNARKHSSRNVEAIAGSLRRFGQRRPLVVAGENVVIAGNGTLEAAKSLGWTEVAISRVPASWDYDTARAYALADNRTAELAEWDSAVLADHLVELDSVGWDIAEFGFESMHPPTGDAGEAFSALPDGERDDATQMTFTLTLRQAEIVKSALAMAKRQHDFDQSDNRNSNGNALAAIVEEWVESVG